MRCVTRMPYEEQDFISVSELDGLFEATVRGGGGTKYQDELTSRFSRTPAV